LATLGQIARESGLAAPWLYTKDVWHMEIREAIAQLIELLSNETDEHRLVALGNEMIINLRREWKVNQDVFSNHDIEVLQKAAAQLDAVSGFLEEEDEFEYIKTIEDADEVVGRLYHLVEVLDGLAISGRIHKEIRGLIERKATLPAMGNLEKNAEVLKAIYRLNAHSPQCRKCGATMIIRQGNGEYFWGCSTFPTCWGKRWLTGEQLKQIPD
jgi:hypothetical protein